MSKEHRWFTPTNVDLSGLIYIRPMGELVPNCSYFLSYEELPQMLKDSHSVEPYGCGGRAYDEISSSSLLLPGFVIWNKKTNSRGGPYCVYSHCQGMSTLDIDQDGNCFKRKPLIKASLLQAGKPIPEYFLSMGNVTWENNVCTVKSAFGKTTTVTVEEGNNLFFITDNDYHCAALLTRQEAIKRGYILCDKTGHFICTLEEALEHFENYAN